MKNVPHKLYRSIIALSRKGGFWRWSVDVLAYCFYSMFRKNKTFKFRRKTYKYFYHRYNRTIASERVVEIPIAKAYLDKYLGKDVLEVGNVMPHYFPTSHDVLDKYEKASGVINKDVVNVKLPKKYDLIISVSTMEHVGYSYTEKKSSTKFAKGVKNLKKYLKKGGKFVVTFSLHYNEFIDELVLNNKMPFDKGYFMKRTSFWNEWKETDYEEAVKGDKYDDYYANSNILYIGEFINK